MISDQNKQEQKTNIHKNQLKCEICYDLDNYCLCSGCFKIYKQNNLEFREDIIKDKKLISDQIYNLIMKNLQRIDSFQKKAKITNFEKKVYKISMYLNKKQECIQKIKLEKENREVLERVLFFIFRAF